MSLGGKGQETERPGRWKNSLCGYGNHCLRGGESVSHSPVLQGQWVGAGALGDLHRKSDVWSLRVKVGVVGEREEGMPGRHSKEHISPTSRLSKPKREGERTASTADGCEKQHHWEESAQMDPEKEGQEHSLRRPRMGLGSPVSPQGHVVMGRSRRSGGRKGSVRARGLESREMTWSGTLESWVTHIKGIKGLMRFVFMVSRKILVMVELGDQVGKGGRFPSPRTLPFCRRGN